eukprot:ANDGO_02344.mRNA.1 Uncharacterized protein C1604.06c
MGTKGKQSTKRERQLQVGSESTEKESPKNLVSSITRLKSEFSQDSRKFANNLAKLLQIMQQSSSSEVVVHAAKALVACFSTFIDSKDLTPGKSARVSDLENVDAGEKATLVFREWIFKKFQVFCGQLLEYMTCDDPGMQVDILTLIMDLTRIEMDALSAKFDVAHDYIQRGVFASLVWLVVSDSRVDPSVVAAFKDNFVFGFDDIRAFVYEILEKQLKKEGSEVSDHAIDTIYDVCGDINLPSTPDELNDFHFSYAALDGSGFRLRDVKFHRKVFTDFWMAYLRKPLTSLSYKRVLLTIHELVLPHVTQPLLLIDFLRDSYNRGGVISLLALHGIFTLIVKYNLDYPDFYKKLYALFEPTVFMAKYRARFFKLADLFLTSPLLPAYVVGAFAKRTARLCLTASPAGILSAIPFIYNLLKRHASCMQLIHRSVHTDSATAVRSNASAVSSNLSTDPYLADEVDPAKCNALASSLWELDTLKSHYCPSVARLVKLFEQEFKKDALDISEFLNHSYQTLFQMEIRRTPKTTPLAFEEFRHVLPLQHPEMAIWNIQTQLMPSLDDGDQLTNV